MAQPSGKKKKPASGGSSGGSSGSRPAGGARPGSKPGIQPGGKAPRTAVQYGPAGSTMSKRAAGGKTGNRTQLIIGGVALVVILAVVIGGILLNRTNTSTKNEGYGPSKSGTVTIADGVITLSAGTAGKPLDLYEDPICPACGLFEQQYGQQIAQAVDEGKLIVNYHPLTFLNQASASGDYSTRANAALMCTAEHLGSVKGLWSSLHTTLFSADVQPEESGGEDMTNDQLNERITTAATGAGVQTGDADLTAATSCVSSGEMIATVTSAVDTSNATLTALVGGVRSPVVVANGTVLNPDDGNWLTDFLAG